MGCERCGNQDVEKWNISPVDLKPGRNRGYYRFFKFFYSEPKIITNKIPMIKENIVVCSGFFPKDII